MPKPPLRIAILECDTPLPKTYARFKGYGGVFEFLLKQGAKALNNPALTPDNKGFDITKWQVEQNPESYPKLEDIDAILITGSSTCALSPLLIPFLGLLLWWVCVGSMLSCDCMARQGVHVGCKQRKEMMKTRKILEKKVTM
jgi:hypothetical protein